MELIDLRNPGVDVLSEGERGPGAWQGGESGNASLTVSWAHWEDPGAGMTAPWGEYLEQEGEMLMCSGFIED